MGIIDGIVLPDKPFEHLTDSSSIGEAEHGEKSDGVEDPLAAVWQKYTGLKLHFFRARLLCNCEARDRDNA